MEWLVYRGSTPASSIAFLVMEAMRSAVIGVWTSDVLEKRKSLDASVGSPGGCVAM